MFYLQNLEIILQFWLLDSQFIPSWGKAAAALSLVNSESIQDIQCTAIKAVLAAACCLVNDEQTDFVAQRRL